ncbi:MAG: single-stranded DNA-binding protein [Chlorobiota bacterium]
MAKSLNRVSLLGNLGRDPEIRTTPQGKQVCTLNLATTESYKDKSGNWQDTTDWHRVVMWDYLAERAGKYLSKGSKVLVEGKLKTRSYEDQSGTTKYITEVLARDMILLDSRSGGDGGSQGGPSHAGDQQPNYDKFEDKDTSDEFDDDVPF